ncbi:MAG: hypothetical protein WCP82_11400 [Alphaproteobacteria bacterium]
MGWRAGTSHAKIDTVVGTLPAIKEHLIDADNGIGEIPPNLATMTQLLLAIHASNGDLAWVSDMLDEMEGVSIDARTEIVFDNLTPDAARQMLVKMDNGGPLSAQALRVKVELAEIADGL